MTIVCRFLIRAEQMFRRFYPESSELLISQFLEAAEALGKELSPAAVQGHFLLFKNSPDLAIANISRLK